MTDDTKTPYKLKQTCIFQLLDCASVYDVLLLYGMKVLNGKTFINSTYSTNTWLPFDIVVLKIFEKFQQKHPWQSSYHIFSNKRPQYLLNFETVRCSTNYREAFIGKMSNIQCVNLVTCSFKIRMKPIFTINKPNIMKKSKHKQYFHCFTFCILVPYAFGLATGTT